MANYTPTFTKPYPSGWVDKPSKTTPATAAIMNSYDTAIAALESYLRDDRVISSEVLSAKYHAEAENHGVFIRERLTIDVEGVSAEIDFGDIGKTVFLTKSEAEAKLKELRGRENER